LVSSTNYPFSHVLIDPPNQDFINYPFHKEGGVKVQTIVPAYNYIFLVLDKPT
jgi:hypothetical protein